MATCPQFFLPLPSDSCTETVCTPCAIVPPKFRVASQGFWECSPPPSLQTVGGEDTKVWVEMWKGLRGSGVVKR